VGLVIGGMVPAVVVGSSADVAACVSESSKAISALATALAAAVAASDSRIASWEVVVASGLGLYHLDDPLLLDLLGRRVQILWPFPRGRANVSGDLYHKSEQCSDLGSRGCRATSSCLGVLGRTLLRPLSDCALPATKGVDWLPWASLCQLLRQELAHLSGRTCYG